MTAIKICVSSIGLVDSCLGNAHCFIAKHKMKIPLPDSLKNLYKIAKQRNFTWEGEMFRIDELLEMARTLVGSSRVKLSEMSLLSSRDVVQILLSGGTIVVPYDSMSGNYEPSFQKGARSHYCVVVGFVWNNETNKGYESFDLTDVKNSPYEHRTHREFSRCISTEWLKSSLVTSWNQLVRSNAQLDNQSKQRKETLERKQ